MGQTNEAPNEPPNEQPKRAPNKTPTSFNNLGEVRERASERWTNCTK